MTTLRVLILSLLLVAFMAASSEAGWLIYSEPAFNGQILDIETKQPIERAVVVVEYNKKTMGIGASMSSVMDVRETLTDKDGNFHFPSYTTLIQPFSWQIPSRLIIFKLGYASVKLGAGYFSQGEWEEQSGSWPDTELRMLTYKLSGHGIVELPKLKTRAERLKAIPSSPTDIRSKELPLLYKAINEERRSLDLDEIK